MFGRHGEAPVPIVAAKTPSHCFEAAIEAVRIALKYRTPVFLLSDGYLANGSEPWRLPDVESPAGHLGRVSPPSRTPPRPTARRRSGPMSATPRRWRGRGRFPGTPGLEHRIGGLEKDDGIGQRLLRARQPRGDGARPGGQDRRHRQGPDPGGGRRPDGRRQGPRPRLGLDLRRHHRRRETGAQGRAGPWPSSTSCT